MWCCFKLATCMLASDSHEVSPWEMVQAQQNRNLNKIKPQRYRAMCPDLPACPKIIGSLTSQLGLVLISKTNRRIGLGLHTLLTYQLFSGCNAMNTACFDIMKTWTWLLAWSYDLGTHRQWERDTIWSREVAMCGQHGKGRTARAY